MELQAGGEGDVLVVIPPRPPRPVRRPRRSQGPAVLRWSLALTALLLAGSSAAVAGWRSLADGPASDPRPGPRCVARAVAEAQAFAAVLGDTRPVDRTTLERACAGLP